MPLANIVATALTAAQTISAPVQPTGPWVVAAEESHCRLEHTFGKGADKLTIGFQPMFNADSMELIIVRPDRSEEPRAGSAKVKFGPGGKNFTGTYYSAEVPGAQTRLWRLTIKREAFDQFAVASEMTIAASRLRFAVRLPKPEKGVAAFRVCEESLLKSWGVDPAIVRRKRSPEPLNNVSRYFAPENYPMELVRSVRYARVVIAVQVSATGTVTDCHVVASAGNALDKVTCEQSRKVNFRPALDDTGKAVNSIFMLSVSWTPSGEI